MGVIHPGPASGAALRGGGITRAGKYSLSENPGRWVKLRAETQGWAWSAGPVGRCSEENVRRGVRDTCSALPASVLQHQAPWERWHPVQSQNVTE